MKVPSFICLLQTFHLERTGKVVQKKKTMLPRQLAALEPETKFFHSATGADYSDVVMPEVQPDASLTALDKVVSAEVRRSVFAGSAEYKCCKKVPLCSYGVVFRASLAELKVQPGCLMIVFNKEGTPYWFHQSKVFIQLPPHADASDGVVIPSEACSEPEEEDADDEDKESADDPGSDNSEYTGKGTARVKKTTKTRRLSQRVLTVLRRHLRAGATQRQKVRKVVFRQCWQRSSQGILQMLSLRGVSHY